jgi:hypothetical protein
VFSGSARLPQILGYDPKYEGFDPQYPAPPGIHWLGLIGAWCAAEWLIAYSVPENYQALASSMVAGGWVFYVCNWIGRLMPGARSPFWCDVLLVVQLASVGLASGRHPPVARLLVADVLGLGAVILGIITIFLVRNDLENHYNNREHAGLVLNGAMTFFFSFLYFQYHLYDIAKRKHAAESFTARQLS